MNADGCDCVIGVHLRSSAVAFSDVFTRASTRDWLVMASRVTNLRPEFLDDVRAGIHAQNDAARGESRGHRSGRRRLPQARNHAASERAGEFARRDRSFSRGGFARHHRALQRVFHPRTKTRFARRPVADLFMTQTRYAKMYRVADHMLPECGAESLRKSRSTLTPFVRHVATLIDSRADRGAPHGFSTKGVPHVVAFARAMVGLWLRHGRHRQDQKDRYKRY